MAATVTRLLLVATLSSSVEVYEENLTDADSYNGINNITQFIRNDNAKMIHPVQKIYIISNDDRSTVIDTITTEEEKKYYVSKAIARKNNLKNTQVPVTEQKSIKSKKKIDQLSPEKWLDNFYKKTIKSKKRNKSSSEETKILKNGENIMERTSKRKLEYVSKKQNEKDMKGTNQPNQNEYNLEGIYSNPITLSKVQLLESKSKNKRKLEKYSKLNPKILSEKQDSEVMKVRDLPKHSEKNPEEVYQSRVPDRQTKYMYTINIEKNSPKPAGFQRKKTVDRNSDIDNENDGNRSSFEKLILGSTQQGVRLPTKDLGKAHRETFSSLISMDHTTKKKLISKDPFISPNILENHITEPIKSDTKWSIGNRRKENDMKKEQTEVEREDSKKLKFKSSEIQYDEWIPIFNPSKKVSSDSFDKRSELIENYRKELEMVRLKKEIVKAEQKLLQEISTMKIHRLPRHIRKHSKGANDSLLIRFKSFLNKKLG